MTKTIALSLVAAASISLAACTKEPEANNAATNAVENVANAADNAANAADNAANAANAAGAMAANNAQ